MLEAKPYGLFVRNGGSIGDDDAAFVDNAMRKLGEHRRLSGLLTAKIVKETPDGGVLVAYDLGETRRAIYYPPLKPTEIASKEIKRHDGSIPMLYCGSIDTRLARLGEGISIDVTDTTRRRLGNYDPEKTHTGPVNLKRFRVKIPIQLSEFKPDAMLEDYATQYNDIRPTWWNGPMAEVIQIVGGFGKQSAEESLEDLFFGRDSELLDDPKELQRLELPDWVAKATEDELKGFIPTGFTGEPPASGQFQFNYKFNSTDSVYFDSSGYPWLINVSRKGIYAMPLPVIPASTTAAFRLWMEEINDDEILWILDRFKGIPSGEAFPASSGEFEAWRRAGVIMKLGDTGRFYEHDAFSTACGWAFNSNGTEGFNTATGLDEGSQIPFCVGYSIRININPVANHWNNQPEPHNIILLSDSDKQAMAEYLGLIYGEIRANTVRNNAIKYKLKRVPLGLIMNRVNAFILDGQEIRNKEGEVNYWDGVEIAPITNGRAICAQATKGNMYSKGLANFKIPEPFLGGCISHSVQYLYPDAKSGGRSDTVLYGYYLGDDLKVIKYFADSRTFNAKVEGNFEDCMTVGQWEQTERTSPSYIATNLYTTDYDEREEIAESYKITKIKGEDLGYPEAPEIRQIGSVFSMHFELNRRRYFSRVTNVKTYSNESKSVYSCVPFYMRAASLFGSTKSKKSIKETETGVRLWHQDPNYYGAWWYDWSSRWVYWESWMDSYQIGVDPSPFPFMVEKHFKGESGGCSDFADSGPWMGEGTDITNLVENYPYTDEWYGGIGGASQYLPQRPSYREYSTERTTPVGEEIHKNYLIAAKGPNRVDEKKPYEEFFYFYPDENGMVLNGITGMENRAGVAFFASIATGRGRKRFGECAVADGSASHHLIGVVNG